MERRQGRLGRRVQLGDLRRHGCEANQHRFRAPQAATGRPRRFVEQDWMERRNLESQSTEMAARFSSLFRLLARSRLPLCVTASSRSLSESLLTFSMDRRHSRTQRRRILHESL